MKRSKSSKCSLSKLEDFCHFSGRNVLKSAESWHKTLYWGVGTPLGAFHVFDNVFTSIFFIKSLKVNNNTIRNKREAAPALKRARHFVFLFSSGPWRCLNLRSDVNPGS